ncbi:MAG: aldo/keto reductase [Acidilobaceae archaeon]
MEYVFLGSTDLKISRIGLGTWQFSETWGLTDYKKAKAVIEEALRQGINFFDTAMAYGNGLSESFLGRALKELQVKRDEVVIVTKIPGELLRPHDIMKAIERSLSRLQLNEIDVLLVHWPPCWDHIPTCTYMRTLERLSALGKVGYLGLSDYPIELVESARQCLARADIEVLQVKFNLVEREAEEEHIPYAEANGMTVMAWSPLAKGALTGKYTLEDLDRLGDLRASDPLFSKENYSKVLELVEVVRSVGKKYEKTPAQVALNWLISYSDVIVPIPGAKSPDQVRENAGAVGWSLSYNDWLLLNEASRRVTAQISYAVW